MGRKKSIFRSIKKSKYNFTVLAIVAVVLIIAGYALIHTHASQTAANLNAGNAKLAGRSAACIDPTAANNIAVRFGGANGQPLPWMASPKNGDTIKGIYTLSAGVDNYISGQKVQFWHDGLQAIGDGRGSTVGYVYDWNTAGISNGVHTLSASTTDAKGNLCFSSSFSITINNTNRERVGITPGTPYLPPNMSEDAFWAKVKSTGVGWIRVDFSMNNTGNVHTDEVKLQQAQKNGFKVVATLLGGNTSDHQGWANFAGSLAAFWRTSYPGIVQAVEPVNEVNGSYGNFGNGAPDYTDLLRRTYQAVKAQSPNMTVLTSGFSPAGGNWAAHSTDSCASDGGWRNPATFLDDMYANNGNSSAGLFDAVAYHPYDSDSSPNYGGGPCNAGGYRPIGWLRQVMNSHNDASKKIWATEAGWAPICGNEQPAVDRFNWDMNDWFYGVHDSNGATVGSNPAGGDWNTGPFMIYKMYQDYDQPQWGMIFTPGQCGTDYHDSLLYGAIQSFTSKQP